MDSILIDKIRGCLYGQAIGDALGLGAEFLNKEEISKYYPNGLSKFEEIIQDNHRKRWEKGAWTDDTDMMLCILEAYDGKEFNIRQIAQNFKDWSDGVPMGIGSHTEKILFMRDYVEVPFDCSQLWWKISRCTSAPNGAVMRTSVVGCEKNNVEHQAEQISKLTHYDPRCVGSCVIVSEVIHNLIWKNKELSYNDIQEIGKKYDERISDWVYVAYSGTLDDLDLDNNYEMGYTLRTLGASLWAYFHSTDFLSGLLTVINEGGDADTNGAVTASILGSKYGCSSIPEYYLLNLHNRKLFEQKVDDFISKLKI